MATTPPTDRDAEIRRVLASHGDDGRRPRHTVFYFYGGDFEELGRQARAAGYGVRPTAKQDGVVLETTTAVDEQTFEEHATRMAEWAEQFGSEYDGWECQLVKVNH
jgi:Regulator of ribonuclease activity B